MNAINLENLKEEIKTLGFSAKLTAEMEKYMQSDVERFTLHENRPAARGQVDLVLYFKKSSQSDYYYLNKFQATHSKGQPLEEGQKYMVIYPGENGKNNFRSFPVSHEAIAYFKEQRGSSELAIGTDLKNRTMMVGKEKGIVTYIDPSFKANYAGGARTHTFYVQQGKGFTARQAANLIEGRAVYRNDLLTKGGEMYKAWVTLDFGKPKDAFQNFHTNHYHDPSYGFDLKETLGRYGIKELGDAGKRENLLFALKQGDLAPVTVLKTGEERRLHLEAVPRYGNVNFYNEKGVREKREQFDKTLSEKKVNAPSRGKGRDKDLAESRGISV